jgi:hypothetical protein
VVMGVGGVTSSGGGEVTNTEAVVGI